MSLSSAAITAVVTAMQIAGKTITYDRDMALTAAYNVQTGDFTTDNPPTPFTPVTGRGYCDKYTTKEVDEKTIFFGDQKLYAQLVTNYIPAINDIVTINNVKHRIMDVYPIEAEEGIVILYQIQLRK